MSYCSTHESIEPDCVDCVTRFHCEQRDKLEAERDKLKARVEKLELGLKNVAEDRHLNPCICNDYEQDDICATKIANAALEQGEGGV